MVSRLNSTGADNLQLHLVTPPSYLSTKYDLSLTFFLTIVGFHSLISLIVIPSPGFRVFIDVADLSKDALTLIFFVMKDLF